MLWKATLDIFLDVETQAEACDGIAETLREHLRRYTPESCIIDWRYSPAHPVPVPATRQEADECEPDDEFAAHDAQYGTELKRKGYY